MTITHELQAPLAAILAWARLLQTKSFDPTTTARALATIERNATIEAKLVKELLEVSSILSGKFQLNPQPIDLISLTTEVVTTLRSTAEAKQIQLIEIIPDAAQVTVSGDPARLKQIIVNLLVNAIKFTPEGGQVEVDLSIVIARSPLLEAGQIATDRSQLTNAPQQTINYAQIAVTDTGIGISPNFLPYVFDRFSQAEVPSRHSPGGVGIGLAIAYHLVELHHGKIEVESEGEGRGATFTVKLPLV